ERDESARDRQRDQADRVPLGPTHPMNRRIAAPRAVGVGGREEWMTVDIEVDGCERRYIVRTCDLVAVRQIWDQRRHRSAARLRVACNVDEFVAVRGFSGHAYGQVRAANDDEIGPAAVLVRRDVASLRGSEDRRTAVDPEPL